VTVIQGIVVLLAVAVTTANLLADLIYGFLDPRIRIQGRS
jgi:peptide/nickel transport system permease protein